jgi:hypothetical protein
MKHQVGMSLGHKVLCEIHNYREQSVKISGYHFYSIYSISDQVMVREPIKK